MIPILICVILALTLILTLVILVLIHMRRWHDREATAEAVELERTEVRDSVVEAAIGMHSASVIQMCHAIQSKVDAKIPTEIAGRGTMDKEETSF